MIAWIRRWGFRGGGRVVSAVVVVAILALLTECRSTSRDRDRPSTRNEGISIRLDADFRDQVLTEVANSIRDHYADGAIGESLASTIMTNLRQGQFDSVVGAEALVEEVMAVIRTKVADRHFDFAVRRESGEPPAGSGNARRSAHGLKTTRLLDDRIAYLEFDGLPGDDASMTFVKRALAALPAVDALIIDVRDNIGGSGDMVVLLCSHLLEAGTFLYDYRGRSDTLPGVMKAGHYGRTRIFGPQVPVYVLTGEATRSAAEVLAYILQNHGRARIVGQQTAGMANPSRRFSIGAEFTLTIPFLLFGYGEDHGTFAGVGVQPDRVVPADSALEVVLAEISAARQSRDH